MRRELKKRGPVPSFQIKAEIQADLTSASIDVSQLAIHLDKNHVSISLRYFKKSCECFSKWQRDELKKFSATIDKLSGFNASQLMRYLPLCDIHKGPPAEGRFAMPDGISPDQVFHEIKVDPSNKLRVHGFFAESVFFLVWLDREHACFPER